MGEATKQRALAALDERTKKAIKLLAEPLAELSRIAHEESEIDRSDKDEGYPEFDRIHWLGIVVNALPQLCGPHLRVIAELIDALPIEDEEQEAAVHNRAKCGNSSSVPSGFGVAYRRADHYS